MEKRRDSSNPSSSTDLAGVLTVVGVLLLCATNLCWVFNELYRRAATPEAIIDPIYPIFPVPISWVFIGIGVGLFTKQVRKVCSLKEQRLVIYYGVVMSSIMLFVTGFIVFVLPILDMLSDLYWLTVISSGVLFILAMSILALLFQQFYPRTKKIA